MAKQRVLGYTRVSTAEQVDGFGLEVQQRAITEHCRSRGLRLVDVLSDEGQSGSNGLDDRHGLAEALARIDAGEASGLVVYRLDRLARDLLLQETIVTRLREGGADIISTSEPDLGGADPTRDLVRQLLGAISQYERAVIRGRMLAGKAAKARKGGYVGGQPAYGTRAEDKALVADEGEAELVATVKRLRAEGRSYRDIATALDQAGYPTRRGGPWQAMVVRSIAQR